MFFSRQTRTPTVDADTLDDIARGLGWFSIGLGLAELVAPRTLTRALGMEEEAEIVRAYGLREIAAGVGLLTQKDPTPWLWGRVAGDVLDLATLAIGMDKRNPQRSRVGMALGVVGAITLLDVAVAAAAGRANRSGWWAQAMDRLGIAGAGHRLRDMAEEAYDRGRSVAGGAYSRSRHLIDDTWSDGRERADDLYDRSSRAVRSGWRQARDGAYDYLPRRAYPVRGRAFLDW